MSDSQTIVIGEKEITKSDFIHATNELDDPSKSEFYFFIKQNPSLNAFLSNGKFAWFTNYRHESIFTDADFVDFISPYFSFQYNKLLLRTFQEGQLTALKKLVVNEPLVNNKYRDEAYKGISMHLKAVEDELQEIRTDIDNEEGYYEEETAYELGDDIKAKVNVDLVNALPAYFQAQRNEIAQKIRNVSVAVFNKFDNEDTTYDVISYALDFKSTGLTQQGLQDDFSKLQEIYEDRKQAQKYAPTFEEYASIVMAIGQMIEQIEKNQLPISSIQGRISQLISITELNQYPDLFNEVRQQVALALRGLSVEIWNQKQDVEVAIGIIGFAKRIDLNNETKERLDAAYVELVKLRDKQIETIIESLRSVNKAIKQVKNTPGQTINTNKIQEVLNDIFQADVILSLKNIGNPKRHEILDELKPIVATMPEYFVISLVDKMKPVMNDDGTLLTKLDTILTSSRWSNLLNEINEPSSSADVLRRMPTPVPSATPRNDGENSWIWWLVGIVFFFFCLSQCS